MQGSYWNLERANVFIHRIAAWLFPRGQNQHSNGAAERAAMWPGAAAEIEPSAPACTNICYQDDGAASAVVWLAVEGGPIWDWRPATAG